MSQISSGIRSILSHPLVYKLLQSLVGMHKARCEYTEKYLRPTPRMKILDVGCGPADLLAYLPGSVDYYGIDFNASYIDHAKNKFGDKGTFICGDVNDANLDLQPQFDLIIATGLLHHLDDDNAVKLLKTLATKMHASSRMITLDPCYIENNTPLVKLIMRWDRGQNIRNAENYRKLAAQAFSQITVHVRDNMSRIPRGTAAILECSIAPHNSDA